MFFLKFLGLKWILGFAFLAVVFVAVAALYLAVIGGVSIPGLSEAFRVDPEPPSPEVLARAEAVERQIDEALEDKSAFFLQLTDQNLTDLLQSELSSEDRIQGLGVEIRDEDVKISGELAGRIGVGFSGVIGILLDNGEVQLDLKSVNLSSLPTPGFVEDEIQPFIDEVLDINERLKESGATQIQAVNLSPGVLQIIGVQLDGATVSASTISALQAQGSPSTPPTPPGGSVVPTGRTGSESGSPLYLALGDSLAANVGVADPREGYVSRFHAFLESERGQVLGLTNLGVSGESTLSLVDNGQLSQALSILNGADDVAVLTIDLGANDLLAHLGSGDCTGGDTGPRAAACTARLDAALGAFSDNFGSILDQLDAALDDDAEFYVMTAYNPFDLGIGIPFEEFSSGVVADLNELIAAEAQRVGATLADPFPLMADNAGAWTNMLTEGDIHPNADGFQALAFSLAEARGS